MDKLKAELSLIQDSGLFDKQWYLKQYPDVRLAGIDPIKHYLKYGAILGRNPNPTFDTMSYLKSNSNVKKKDINPFCHYLKYGNSDERSPVPDAVSIIANESTISSPEISDTNILEGFVESELIKSESTGVIYAMPNDTFDENECEFRCIIEVLSSDFDKEYYLARYPDIEKAKVNPLLHYISKGWKEERDPSFEFSTSYYLDANSDVRESGVNPFYHYLVQGYKEGRLPKMPGGFRTKVLENIESLDERIKNWKRNEEFQAIDQRTLSRKLSNMIDASQKNSIVISVSHDDYTMVAGGIQVCLATEEEAFMEKKAIYLNISPAQPLPCLSTSNDIGSSMLRLLCNGSNIGYCRAGDLIKTLDKLKYGEKSIGFNLIVHSVLGHRIENIIKLCEKLEITSPVFWLHDYFSICPGYTLLRNDIEYCEAPSSDSQACNICIYGEKRGIHLENMNILFNRLNFVIVSPSEVALDIWKNKSGLPFSRSHVHEHCGINFQSIRIESNTENLKKKPLQIAFIGYPAIHKGWPIFEEIVLQNRNDSRYKFHHLGSSVKNGIRLEFTKVKVTPKMRSAMNKAILEKEIDMVVLPNIWPETFNIVVYEAIAAGATIATTTAAGNIPCVVRKYGRGLVFDDEKKLVEAFQSGKIYEYISEAKRQGIKVGSLEYSGISADLNLD